MNNLIFSLFNSTAFQDFHYCYGRLWRDVVEVVYHFIIQFAVGEGVMHSAFCKLYTLFSFPMQKVWFKAALVNLLIAAIMGAILRFAFVAEIPGFKFQYFLHGHSHVAMLGWVYLALFAFLIHSFLPAEKQKSKYYHRLFWSTQASVLGMLIAFPLQGYAAFSIVFSAIHVVLSYLFILRFLKDLRLTIKAPSIGAITNKDTSIRSVFSHKFIRASFWFLIVSTIALWAMGPIMALDLKGTAWYYSGVQFYLHFQFNGWFIFAVLGLFFKILEDKGIVLPPKLMQNFFILLVISCVLTYALAVTWSTPLPILFLINSVGVTIQFAALVCFLLIIKRLWKELKSFFPKWVGVFFTVAFGCFVLKILIQTAVVVPYIGTVGYTIRNFVIGFLHLMLLGMITGFLLGFGAQKDMINRQDKWVRIGFVFFLIGFLLSELILFGQGLLFWGAMGFIPKYYEILFGVSVLMPLGIGGILLGKKQN
ncbi:hypothetical protein OAF63_03380 [Saprospiraceae bacterium]|nr:hypothetical protein [Saprospiraceae bacterium]